MMWNDEWERQNQASLKEQYEQQKPYEHYTWEVRKIICGGCGKAFYTRIHSKKYCNNATCGRIGNYRHQRQRRLEARQDRICAGCGKTFTPKRADAKYCSNACRQRAYRESVAADGCGQIEHNQYP